jgi:hypothetical protein
VLAGLTPDGDKYNISESDARLIQAYQLCKHFNTFDYHVYSNNPAWWNAWCLAMIRTENKAEADRKTDG